MPARIIEPFQGGENNPENKGAKQAKAPVKTVVKKEEQTLAAMQESLRSVEQTSIMQNAGLRAQFYGGSDRLGLLGGHVQRVRELQEENDHLQREILSKEAQIPQCTDPLAILADIEHRKVLISRNTGEILKIHLKNEERLKRIEELKSHNSRIQKEMMEVQGRFISTKDMEEKTKFASEFFILKSEIERNLSEIEELTKN